LKIGITLAIFNDDENIRNWNILLANTDIIGAITVAEHFTACIGMSSCPHDFLLARARKSLSKHK